MSRVAELKKEMIEVYGNYCWMNEMWIPKPKEILTYHHILEKRNGGKVVWENGALLSGGSHHYLNYLDYEYHRIYNELNGMFYDLNRTFMPPTEDYYEEVKRILKKVDK